MTLFGTFGIAGSDTGVDVAGTINGQAATGSGRLLTSTAGDSEGLTIEVTGSTTGDRGTVTFSRGLTGSLADLVEEFTGTNGRLGTTTDSLQSTIDDIQDRIDSLEDRLVLREESLRRQFTAMEQAIATIQQQAASIGTGQ